MFVCELVGFVYSRLHANRVIIFPIDATTLGTRGNTRIVSLISCLLARAQNRHRSCLWKEHRTWLIPYDKLTWLNDNSKTYTCSGLINRDNWTTWRPPHGLLQANSSQGETTIQRRTKTTVDFSEPSEGKLLWRRHHPTNHQKVRSIFSKQNHESTTLSSWVLLIM